MSIIQLYIIYSSKYCDNITIYNCYLTCEYITTSKFKLNTHITIFIILINKIRIGSL